MNWQNLKQKLQSKKVLIRKICLIGLGVFVLGLIGMELFLRWHYGLCDAVLMRSDPDYEYIAQPDQNRKRRGNNVMYNSYSMRSENLRPGSYRILGIGDSIINGGTFTDQAELATTILGQRFSSELKKDVQFLNISAGSWGPDNCAAYLRKHGHFNASAIILVTSSHDARDTMTFVPVVGRLKYYPDRQYKLAIVELLDRYLNVDMSFFHKTKDEMDQEFKKQHHIEQASEQFNPGFSAILEYTKKNKILFYLYLHATKQELNDGKYNQYGKDIIDFAKRNNIPIICDLEHGLDSTWFVDDIHYSSIGQKKMADLIFTLLRKDLKNTKY